jgi:2-C-methyl-D-erythritol 4-phosphate cytidylyltransferase
LGEVWGVVVAAGRGDRFGSLKQLAELGGVRIVDRSVCATAAACDRVVVVVPAGADWQLPILDPPLVVAIGGDTRAQSVRNGLARVPASAEVILVHDAARPLASEALFRAVIDAVRAGADGAVPGLAVTDTLKRVDADRIVETVDRVGLVSVQTPQAFRGSALRAAHAGGADASDDAAVVEAHGGNVAVVAGESSNIKVTTPSDLRVASALLGDDLDGRRA